ncbi:hypothetical protein TSOC_012907 [Tetrabaena socialis]|uniref:Uncharacterized protein n=1 Tax=Tetrabaena socialis TaxID=47790 RepID=A0A2J7ZLS7_9CHLO|nr:hypothetical protein TSOC_012907 [Tetrabaena socialis]|eukprot:PNH01219.1 hypothetical protein TSOC_012907 [Tetrabaena socialis]
MALRWHPHVMPGRARRQQPWAPLRQQQMLGAAAAVLITLMLAPQRAWCGPWDLATFRLCRFLRLKETKDNASGVTYMPESNTLWVVLDDPLRLQEYDMDARLLRRLNIKGLLDPEDVVYVSRDRVAVVEEPPQGGIRVLDVSKAGKGRQMAFIPVNNLRSLSSGNEGISYNPRTGAYIVAQEKKPKRLISVQPTANGSANWTTLVNGGVSYPMLADLAAVSYIPKLDQLFVLSQRWRGGSLAAVGGVKVLDVPGTALVPGPPMQRLLQQAHKLGAVDELPGAEPLLHS